MKPNHLLAKDGFSVLVSLEAPKGTDLAPFVKNAERIKGRADGVLVSDVPDAVMRMTPIAVCARLAGVNVPSVLGVNARDRNRLAIQGDLLGAWSMGITDMLIEDGKDPSYGDHPLARPVQDISSLDMAKAVTALNNGQDLAGQSISGQTDFFCGAWVEWLDDDTQVEKEFARMTSLVHEGVKAFVTSPQFDADRAAQLCSRTKALGAKVFVGAMLLKSVGMARYLNEVPGVSKVPQTLIDQMANAPVKPKAGIEIAAEFIRKMEKVADGAVILPVGWEHKAPELLDALGR